MTLANERCWRSEAEIRAGMLERWHVMQACVERGCRQEGILPGGLKVRRRAPELFRQLSARDERCGRAIRWPRSIGSICSRSR